MHSHTMIRSKTSQMESTIISTLWLGILETVQERERSARGCLLFKLRLLLRRKVEARLRSPPSLTSEQRAGILHKNSGQSVHTCLRRPVISETNPTVTLFSSDELEAAGKLVPIGLTDTAIGGQRIEEYMVNDSSLTACSDRSGETSPEWNGRLFGSQTLGFVDMTVKGWVWYQVSDIFFPPCNLEAR